MPFFTFSGKFADGEHSLTTFRTGARFLPFQKVEKALVDGGYNGKPFEDFIRETLDAEVEVEVAKRSELHKFAVIPKRGEVERSIAWIEKCRRLWKNCERKLETSLAFMRLAFISLLLILMKSVLID